MKNSGFCRKISHGSGTIMLQIDTENFKIINKLQSYSCTKMKVGDYLVVDEDKRHYIFSKDLVLKSMKKSHNGKYKLNDDKTKIVTSWTHKTRSSFLIIENEFQLDIFRLLADKKNFEIGTLVVFDKHKNINIVSKEDFFVNYKVMR